MCEVCVYEAKNKIGEIRNEIDSIDAKLMELLRQRFDLAKQIGGLKKANDLEITDTSREKVVIDNAVKAIGDCYSAEAAELMAKIMELSKRVQQAQ